MKYTTLFYIIFSAFILNSCEMLFPCLDGNGVLKTEERAVSAFTSVISTSDFDVEIRYGADPQVTVDADENLQQYIRTYVEDGELMLETDQGRCLQSQNRILVTVYCPYIETVVLSGSGDVDMSSFSADSLKIKLSGSGDFNSTGLVITKSLEVNLTGSGDITIDGKAAESNYYLSGSGDIRGNLLKSTISKVVLSGSGNVYTYVYEYLKVVLSGSGNVYYYGDPADTDERITGSGKIIKN
jgi:hypothetical protein